MIDYNKTLVTNLSSATGLPVYFELFVDSSTQTPCITYRESGDSSYREGDTLRYSKLRYTIKLWGDDLSTLIPKLELLDTNMKSNGFTRLSYNTLTYNQHIQLILDYEGLGKETI